MLQFANVGVKGRMHICIQHVLHTSAETIYQYCNIFPIYLLNIHIDIYYLNINNYIISTNYRMHIAIIECVSCTCTVPVSLIFGQLVRVKTYSKLSLFYIRYCTSLTPIPPTIQYIDISAIWSSQ